MERLWKWWACCGVALSSTVALATPYESQCEKGDLLSCRLFGAELAEKFKKKQDPAVGERAFHYLAERACRGGDTDGCSWADSFLGAIPGPVGAYYRQRLCEGGYLPSCVRLALDHPTDKRRLLANVCGWISRFDGKTPGYQWGSAATACWSLANEERTTNPVRAAKLSIVAAVAWLETNEASWSAEDSKRQERAIDEDDRRFYEAARPARSGVDPQAFLDLANGLAGVARSYNANVAQANAMVRQAQEARAARAAQVATSGRPPSHAPISMGPRPAVPPLQTHHNAPSLRGGMTQNSAPAGSVPVAQATQTQLVNARLQCMQQPVMVTHVTENNVFAVHAKRYESLREDAQRCPADPRQAWADCIGSNVRLWPDATVQMDVNHTVARAAKVNVPFPSIDVSRTRDGCVSRGKNNCYYDLDYKIKRLWEAYNHYQGVVDGETRERKRVAEQARDQECRRRYP